MRACAQAEFDPAVRDRMAGVQEEDSESFKARNAKREAKRQRLKQQQQQQQHEAIAG